MDIKIRFTNGLSYTLEEAAQEIEAEGELIPDYLIKKVGSPGFQKDKRCALGVLEGDMFMVGDRMLSRPPLVADSQLHETYLLLQKMVEENNSFKGSTKQRATPPCGWLRGQA